MDVYNEKKSYSPSLIQGCAVSQLHAVRRSPWHNQRSTRHQSPSPSDCSTLAGKWRQQVLSHCSIHGVALVLPAAPRTLYPRLNFWAFRTILLLTNSFWQLQEIFHWVTVVHTLIASLTLFSNFSHRAITENSLSSNSNSSSIHDSLSSYEVLINKKSPSMNSIYFLDMYTHSLWGFSGLGSIGSHFTGVLTSWINVHPLCWGNKI